MKQELSYAPARRPEPDLPGSWGLYCPNSDRWLDVVFNSEREAEEALVIIRRARPARR